MLTALRRSSSSRSRPIRTARHVAEVEIDPETGVTDDRRLLDRRRFRRDREPDPACRARSMAASSRASARRSTSTPSTTPTASSSPPSFLDYAMPRADGVPSFQFETRNVPSNDQRLRHQGRRRGGLDRLVPGGDERHRRRAQPRLRHRATSTCRRRRCGSGRRSRRRRREALGTAEHGFDLVVMPGLTRQSIP